MLPEKLTSLAKPLACCAAIALLLYATGIGCPIKFISGISCPGCGMTRAWLAALSGNIRLALAYHPLFWLAPAVVLLLAFRTSLPQALFNVLVCACIAAFLVTWAVRLGHTDDANMLFSNKRMPDIVSVEKPVWASELGLP